MIAKYSRIYFGSEPFIQEKNIFKFEIYLDNNWYNEKPDSNVLVTDQAADQASDQDEKFKMVLEYCKKPRSREEIQNHIKMKHRNNFKKQVLWPLLEIGLLKMMIPDKPSSPNQKYVIADKNHAADQVADQVSDQAADHDEKVKIVLEYCKKPRSRKEIQNYLKMKHRNNFKKQILNPLLKCGLLKMTIPDKPSSPKQKYIIADKD